MDLRKIFLTFWIPISSMIFFSIPPMILVPFLTIYAPDFVELAHNHLGMLGEYAQNVAATGGTAKPRGDVVHTKRGCTCKFPFTYGGKQYHSCMRIDGLYLDGEHKHQLWCDVGDSGCGIRYSPDDAAYTSRKCCYDSCLDKDGKLLIKK